MRVNGRDGSIEAATIEVVLNNDDWIRAINVGSFKDSGIKREIENSIGLSLEDVTSFRQWLDLETGDCVVKAISDWREPTRR